MQKLIAALFAKAFAPLVTLIATLLAPAIASMPLDYAVLSAAFGHILTLAKHGTPVYVAVGAYSATQVQLITESIVPVLGVVNTEFPVLAILTEQQQAEFFSAVAAKLAV